MMLRLSTEDVAVTKRFFQALSILEQKKCIRGLQTFTRTYGLNYWNMTTIKKEPGKRVFKPGCLTYLVRDFGVSAEWLLTGEGQMFKGESCASNEVQGK